MIVFSFIDFNEIKPNADPSLSLYKWINDKNNGKKLYEQIIMCMRIYIIIVIYFHNKYSFTCR